MSHRMHQWLLPIATLSFALVAHEFALAQGATIEEKPGVQVDPNNPNAKALKRGTPAGMKENVTGMKENVTGMKESQRKGQASEKVLPDLLTKSGAQGTKSGATIEAQKGIILQNPGGQQGIILQNPGGPLTPDPGVGRAGPTR